MLSLQADPANVLSLCSLFLKFPEGKMVCWKNVFEKAGAYTRGTI